MGKATIEQYSQIVAGHAPIGIVGAGGINPENVTTSATAANTTLSEGASIVSIFAENTDIRVDVGVGVTADANSRLVLSGTTYTVGLPVGKRGAYRVSIIDA